MCSVGGATVIYFCQNLYAVTLVPVHTALNVLLLLRLSFVKQVHLFSFLNIRKPIKNYIFKFCDATRASSRIIRHNAEISKSDRKKNHEWFYETYPANFKL